ncbi:MAG: AMP-binding protein [Candidatus Saccharimonadales bacterium]|nr:AMP-binding protein [Candidatus Saccharimonadales bacterium]
MTMPPIADTIHDLLEANFKKWADKDYVWAKVDGVYTPTTYGELINRAQAIAVGLIDRGYKDQRIAIFSENSPTWMALDFAIMGYVGNSVGFSKDWLEYDAANAIKIADVDLVFYSKANSLAAERLIKTHPKVEFLQIETDIEDLIRSGEQILKKNPKFLLKHIQDSQSPCKVVFTSGTTALPKAIELTYANMIACGEGLYGRTPTDESDVYYLFLPLHHVYAGIGVFACSFFMGTQVYLSEDVHNMKEELAEAKPTVFCAVPLVYEKFYEAIGEENLAKIEKGLKLARLFQKLGLDIRKSLFKKVHQIFGGRTKYIFSGGAKFDPKIKQLFKDLGLNMIEGYGLSETSSMIAMEYPGAQKLESVGKVFENIEIKFVDKDENGHGEIAVKGANVMNGYYKNPQANKKAFDSDGYFLTGDIGYQDADGNLFIVGRKERLIVTSNGENVSPKELESLISKFSKAITNVVVYQDGNDINARIYVNSPKLPNFKQQIDALNKTLPSFKHIQHTTVMPEGAKSQIKK